MTTGRLEAFSDGVLAIIITIMVLELHQPDGDSLASLIDTTGPSLLTYLLSFIYVGIYWNNHHHTLQIAGRVDGSVLWANLALLFVLSLLPFTTGWISSTDFARVPVMLYGTNLLLAAVAFVALQWRIIRCQGPDSTLRRALGKDWKGKASAVLYLVGIGAAALDERIGTLGVDVALAVFVVVAALWFIPDSRIARTYRDQLDAPGARA